MFERVSAFVGDMNAADTQAELRTILAEITRELGFRHFALTHHVDLRRSSEPAIRIHNYPEEWERYYDRKLLGRTDPVHRACQTTLVGFTWSQLPKMIPLTRMDRALLDAAARQGLEEGYTVPAHVPGEVNGSCSFATARGRPLSAEHFATAQLVGAFAFEAARRLVKRDHQKRADPARFSDRERDCLIWVARGKSDSEIATILGISTETVHQYVKQARANYDAVSRSQLVAHALFSGTISFLDIFKR
ncbi:LuxR family transcriptional regulator [Sphingosinicella terrae]|uniref:LuxR family transcriptional regulator n=1 Tax=Sphingosinicella terrae TaxID=2172047 RepID=UPI000E0CF94E|nr:LuxR family transcriptional regulator [Sphingosinicella terrae]